MGGQFNYWGLWLDCEYGHGECSESCTTFSNYSQLSVNKQFEIRNIEVWAVGEKPKTDDVIIFCNQFDIRYKLFEILCSRMKHV